MNDEEQRLTEIESIAAIFPDLLEETTEKQLSFQFDRNISMNITLPDNYPSTSPPFFELNGPYLSREQKEILHNNLNSIFMENIGLPVIFNWISYIQDFIQDLPPEKPQVPTTDDVECAAVREEDDDMNIQHGEVLTDRKSSFQAHLAAVKCKADVDRVMQILKSNSKICRATHNITAYRFTTEVDDGKSVQHHDCEDDGEHGASSKMLELMDRMKANNVLVVVTRWYGGIHLGPDRFRHINNLTRQILCENNYGASKKL